MKHLYRYYQDFGRSGTLSGVFIADSEDVEVAFETVWPEYDILGKHSECWIEFSENTVSRIDVAETTIEDLLRVIGYDISGYSVYQEYRWRKEDGCFDEQS